MHLLRCDLTNPIHIDQILKNGLIIRVGNIDRFYNRKALQDQLFGDLQALDYEFVILLPELFMLKGLYEFDPCFG